MPVMWLKQSLVFQNAKIPTPNPFMWFFLVPLKTHCGPELSTVLLQEVFVLSLYFEINYCYYMYLYISVFSLGIIVTHSCAVHLLRTMLTSRVKNE